jgi:hypothetical protein
VKNPICSTCDDTHWMAVGGGTALCTRCPTPCQRCRAGGNGPNCEVTPCPCICHDKAPRMLETASGAKVTRADGERIRARDQIVRLRTMIDTIALDVEARGYPPGVNAAQAVTEAAISLAMTMAKLDAYVRAEEDWR